MTVGEVHNYRKGGGFDGVPAGFSILAQCLRTDIQLETVPWNTVRSRVSSATGCKDTT